MGVSGIRAAGMFVVACCLATACASPTPLGLPTEQNVPGTCKVITTAEEMLTSSDVSPAVPCTTEHVYETYGVTTVPQGISELAQRPGPELLTAETADVCPLDLIRPYLGATEVDSQWGLSVWSKFPTREEWSRNVRVVTCAQSHL